MLDNTVDSSKMSSVNLIDPEPQQKSQLHLTGCRLLLGVSLVSLCSIILTVIAFTYSSHPLVGVAGTFRRPPIGADQKDLYPAKRLLTATGDERVAWPEPPPHDEVAKVARYVVHMSDWASISTVSTDEAVKGYPFGNILSVSDGPIDKSSGIPYMYLTPMDFTAKDLEKDPRASLTMSEAQSDYCHKKSYDPEDPRCARVLMSGQIVKVENGTAEGRFAEAAIFSRHPEMKDWPEAHKWFFAKMDITNIYVLDFFGGASHVDVNEYLEAAEF